MTESKLARIRTILLYAQDNRGLGHINRTLTIARHILAAYPNLVAYLATKSRITSNFLLPERCDYIKLPARLGPETIQHAADVPQQARRFAGRVLDDGSARRIRRAARDARASI